MSKKVLVTGAKGQLGQDVVSTLTKAGYEVHGFGHAELDITNMKQVEQVLGEVQPDIVIHSAAYTKVDQAETEQEAAYAVNAVGTRNIAVVSETLGAKLVYISTDYVFNGEEERPYTEFDQASPLGVYGKSKYAGEVFVRDFHSKFFILRTSWVFGAHGGNFVKTMLKLADTQTELKVVDDQRGCPTYTVDLAAFIRDVIETANYGTYHVSNSGECSWYEFAKTIFELSGKTVNVEPVTTKEFPRPAPRPKNSVFDHLAIRLNGFKELPGWRDALERFLTEIQ